MAGLHTEDDLGYAGFRGDGEAAHAAADAGEGGGIDSDHAESKSHHAGDQSGGRGRVAMQDPGVARIAHELGNRGAGSAAAARAREGSAGLRWASANQIHEEAELVVDVEVRIVRLAKPHPVPFTLSESVIFAAQSSSRGATLVLGEALMVVRVEADAARLGLGALAWAHATSSEGAGNAFLAELDRVRWLVAEQGDDHIPGDAHFMRALGPEEAAQAAGEAEVGHVARHWGLKVCVVVLLRVDLEAPMAVKSHSMACKTSGCMGRILSVACRPTAHVRHELR